MIRHLNAFAVAASIFGCSRKMMAKELRDAYCSPYDSWANRIAVHRFVQDIPLKPGDRGYDLVTQVADTLDRLKDVPMLIGWGGRDFVFDRHFLEEWLRRFPDAELHRYADCGHYILEDAGDELIPLIRTFLDAHPI